MGCTGRRHGTPVSPQVHSWSRCTLIKAIFRLAQGSQASCRVRWLVHRRICILQPRCAVVSSPVRPLADLCQLSISVSLIHSISLEVAPMHSRSSDAFAPAPSSLQLFFLARSLPSNSSLINFTSAAMPTAFRIKNAKWNAWCVV